MQKLVESVLENGFAMFWKHFISIYLDGGQNGKLKYINYRSVYCPDVIFISSLLAIQPFKNKNS